MASGPQKVMLESYSSALDSAKTVRKVDAEPGSLPLKNAIWEAYCRFRAQSLPRFVAYREAHFRHSRYARGTKLKATKESSERITQLLERKPEVQLRLQYLTQNALAAIAEKRLALEQRLWGMHEASITDYFEQYQEPITDKNGNPVIDERGAPKVRTRERPRLLTDLPPELAALVEDVTIDSKGRAIPKLYNKLAANKELRAMLDIGRSSDGRGDVSRLSDAELVAQLADQAKALGVDINLNYRFAQSAPGVPVDGVVDTAPTIEAKPNEIK